MTRLGYVRRQTREQFAAPDSTAQLRQSGSILVNCTGKQQTLGSAFTPSSFYSYT